MQIKEIIVIGSGGFLGAISRYLASGWVQNRFNHPFPFGTMMVNVTGSFIIGLLMGIIQNSTVSPLWRLFIGIGFLGAYTTFSTFSYETMMLLRTGSYMEAGLNIILSVVLCLLLVFIGYMAGNAII